MTHDYLCVISDNIRVYGNAFRHGFLNRLPLTLLLSEIKCRPLSTCIEFQKRERQPRPPTALQWGREEAVQFMQLTQASVCVFITSERHSWTLLSERRGFAGRCPSYINA